MSAPDGPEQRTAFYEDTARDREMDCDDEIDADYVRDGLSRIPVGCVVNGHDFHTNQFGLTFCHNCGQDQYDEVGA